MKMKQQELRHLIFLSEVVIDGKKRALMEETLQCLLYLIKSIEEIELPDSVVEHMEILIGRIEAELKSENERLKDIRANLSYGSQRKPLG